MDDDDYLNGKLITVKYRDKYVITKITYLRFPNSPFELKRQSPQYMKFRHKFQSPVDFALL